MKNSTTQKIKFSIKDFFSKCDQIRRKPRIWSHLLKKYLMENFHFFVQWKAPTVKRRKFIVGARVVKNSWKKERKEQTYWKY